MFVVICFWVVVIKNRHALLDHGTQKSAASQEIELMECAVFFIGWAWSKMGIRPFKSYRTLKSHTSHI